MILVWKYRPLIMSLAYFSAIYAGSGNNEDNMNLLLKLGEKKSHRSKKKTEKPSLKQ